MTKDVARVRALCFPTMNRKGELGRSVEQGAN